jgi:hypothetical protein
VHFDRSLLRRGRAIRSNSANAAAYPSTFLMPQRWENTFSKVEGRGIVGQGRERGRNVKKVSGGNGFVFKLISSLIYRQISQNLEWLTLTCRLFYGLKGYSMVYFCLLNKMAVLLLELYTESVFFGRYRSVFFGIYRYHTGGKFGQYLFRYSDFGGNG